MLKKPRNCAAFCIGETISVLCLEGLKYNSCRRSPHSYPPITPSTLVNIPFFLGFAFKSPSLLKLRGEAANFFQIVRGGSGDFFLQRGYNPLFLLSQKVQRKQRVNND